MTTLLSPFQILPPWQDDVQFENFITDYFNAKENTSSYDRFGRSGQKQFGLDIFSVEKKTVIQCKLKNISIQDRSKITKELIQDLANDLSSFRKYNKSVNNLYTRFYFVSTFYSDSNIQTACAQQNDDLIQIEYWSWERIMKNMPAIVIEKYRPILLSFIEHEYLRSNFIHHSGFEFLQDISIIDLIISESKPSKNGIIFILQLLNDQNYFNYFFEKIDKPVWFKILKEKDYFNPFEKFEQNGKNQNALENDIWKPLHYFEKLSNIPDLDDSGVLQEDIFSIIFYFVKTRKINNKNAFLTIKIVSNFPKKLISIDFINLLPVFFSDNRDTFVPSSAICEFLLPKFLIENHEEDDLLKFEKILNFILSIENMQSESLGIVHDRKGFYRFRIHEFFLSETLSKSIVIESTARLFSSQIIINLANSLKDLHMEFNDGLTIKLVDNHNKYEVVTEIYKKDICVKLFIEGQNDYINQKVIANYHNIDKTETKAIYLELFNESNIVFSDFKEENDLNLDHLIFALFNGNYRLRYISPIEDFLEIQDDSKDQVTVLSIFFIKVLSKKLKYNYNEGIELIRMLLSSNEYRLPFFRNVAIYTIAENWNETKIVFFNSLKNNDQLRVLSDPSNFEDLFKMISKNQVSLTKEEKNILQLSIERGIHSDFNSNFDNQLYYWKARWYGALKQIPEFNLQFQNLLVHLNLSSDFIENRNDNLIQRAIRSPLSVRDILDMSPMEIVEFINDYKADKIWDGPTFSGFAENLAQAIGQKPFDISKEIELFKGVKYIYAYSIAEGFKNAWHANLSFDWDRVLMFFHRYILDQEFYSGNLRIDNDFGNANTDTVISSLALLLSEGLTSDHNLMDIKLLPKVKDILCEIIRNMKSEMTIKQNSYGYLSYSFGSVQGKVFKALVEYSLCYGRNCSKEDEIPKMKSDVKELFELFHQKQIIDFYTFTGFYYRQFYFLDSDWINGLVKAFYKIDFENWKAFFEGYTFYYPPQIEFTYKIFTPHYERAIIDPQYKIIQGKEDGLISHIVSYYFLNYDKLNSKGLIKKFIQSKNSSEIKDLVNFILANRNYIYNLVNNEAELSDLVFKLWEFIVSAYRGKQNDDVNSLMATLSRLIDFAQVLDNKYKELLIKTIKDNSDESIPVNLIYQISLLIRKGDPRESAKNAIDIFENLKLQKQSLLINNNSLTEIFGFLCEHGQKDRTLILCNNMVLNGHEFVREVYEKYRLN